MRNRCRAALNWQFTTADISGIVIQDNVFINNTGNTNTSLFVELILYAVTDTTTNSVVRYDGFKANFNFNYFDNPEAPYDLAILRVMPAAE
jgi:hypothetical protein